LSRGKALPVVVLALLAGCTQDPERRVLTVALPMLQQGEIVTDVEFCQQLRPTLRFTRAANGELAFDEQALVPSQENACVFEMAAEETVTRGTYDAEIRFNLVTLPDTCDGVANEIVVGVFARADIVIDEDNGLAPFDDESEFFSRPGETPTVGGAPDFDPDQDGLDNYAEVRAGADPCQAGTAPELDVVVTPADPPEEGQPITFDVSMSNEDGADFLMNIEISQTSDPLATPRAIFRSRTDSPDVIEDAITLRPPDTEAWRYEVASAVSTGDGAATWQVRFFPEEPFVGALDIRVFASFGAGEADIFAETVFNQTLSVTEVPDQTETRFVELDGDGNEVLLARTDVDFREIGPGVTPTEREFVLSNGDVGSDEEDWDITLDAAAIAAGVVLARADGVRWRLTWGPDNAQFLASPGGIDITLNLVDDSNPAPIDLHLGVAPLFNDAPTITDPSVGARSLPSGAFITHSIPFSVDDPDQVDTAPTCTATLTASGATTCTTGFDSVTCGVAGARAGSSWPMEIVLTPSATYVADCGDAPTFTLDIDVADTAPTGADPATPQSASVAALDVRTSQAIAPGTVTSTFPFTNAGFVFIDPDVDGALGRRMGVGTIGDVSGFEYVAVYDLDVPEIIKVYERDETTDDLCPGALAESDEGVVDIVNHKVLLYTRDCNGTSTGASSEAIIDLANLDSVVLIPQGDICAPFNDRLSNPSVDENGDFWIGCDDTEQSLLRLSPDGSLASQIVNAGIGNDGMKRQTYYRDAANAPWYVWPDEDGIHVIDLDDFANPTATETLLSWPVAPAAADDIEDFVIDTRRDAYTFVFKDSDADDALWRVTFGGGPALEGPLVLTGVSSGSGSNGGLRDRILLKHPLADPTGTDAVVSGGGDYVRPHIDLDTFTLTGERGASCTQDAECLMPGETCFLAQNICSDFFDVRGNGFHSSPDRRFLVFPVDDEDLAGPGAWLYGWEPDDPRSLLVLGVPDGVDSSPLDASVSNEGFLMVIPDGDRVDVLYFVEAEAGLDQ
jgi:hypothetical protein